MAYLPLETLTHPLVITEPLSFAILLKQRDDMKRAETDKNKTPKSENLVRLYLEGTYFESAFYHYEHLKTLYALKKSVRNFGIQELRSQQHDILVSMVFCAMSAEALINYYAIERLGEKYFSDHLDRLDVVSKWAIVPRLLDREILKKGVEPLNGLQELIGWRNDLVHYKSVWKKTPMSRFHPTVRDVYRALKTVDALAQYLKRVDEGFRVDWPKVRINKFKYD